MCIRPVSSVAKNNVNLFSEPEATRLKAWKEYVGDGNAYMNN